MSRVLRAMQRVMSIQSHVVSGYVGNKSATFPLQVLGFDVDAVNSVQFSNHTGYGHCGGQVLNETQLDELMAGLRRNNLLCRYSHLLTGYIGSESFLARVAHVVAELKRLNARLTYVCDPVMGDNGVMYVPRQLLPVYQQLVVPLADILTPNQFEAELLTDVSIVDVASAVRAMDRLHEMGVKTVVLTSTELGSSDHLVGLASQQQMRDGAEVRKDGAQAGDCEGSQRRRRYRIDIPRLPVAFTGSGDLFAACLLAWMEKTDGDLAEALEKTMATLQSVLTLTANESGFAELGNARSSEKAFAVELKLIQSLEAIRNPQALIKAQELNV